MKSFNYQDDPFMIILALTCQKRKVKMKLQLGILIITAIGSLILLPSCGTQNNLDFLIPVDAQAGETVEKVPKKL